MTGYRGRPVATAWAGARDRVAGWRDGLLGSRGFQRWAAGFALTRPIARRHAAALFDLCAGFVYSQVLFACVQLGLFDLLADGALTAETLAARCDVPETAMRRLLEAAAALDLLRARGPDRFGLGTLGAALRGNPAIPAMVAHHALLYRDLDDPAAMLRAPRGQSRLGAYWSYATSAAPAALSDDGVAGYTTLMGASQPMIADEVLAAHDFRRHRCLLDVGGGDGSFLLAVAMQAPAVRLILFDLPAVADRAAARLQAMPPAARIECVGGDFTTGALPAGADIISFVRVLHDHDDDAVQHLLRVARAALAPGGTILIAEPMADTPRAAAYFSVYLHVMGRGRLRSAAELTRMLRQAGFGQPRMAASPTPLLARVLTATVSLC